MGGRGEEGSQWRAAREMFSNRIERGELKPGDHIYSWRLYAYVYAHHGIYIGDGMVVHFTTAGSEMSTGVVSSSCSRGRGDPGSCRVSESGVVKSCLDCFLSGGDLYRFEYSASWARFLVKVRGLCSKVPSDPPEEVVDRALRLLERGFGTYNLLNKNCEDFAIYCKTTYLADPLLAVLGQSSQVRSTVNAATIAMQPCRLLTVAITGALAALVIVPLGISSAASFWSDIGSRAQKVPLDELEGFLSRSSRASEQLKLVRNTHGLTPSAPPRPAPLLSPSLHPTPAAPPPFLLPPTHGLPPSAPPPPAPLLCPTLHPTPAAPPPFLLLPSAVIQQQVHLQSIASLPSPALAAAFNCPPPAVISSVARAISMGGLR